MQIRRKVHFKVTLIKELCSSYLLPLRNPTGGSIYKSLNITQQSKYGTARRK